MKPSIKTSKPQAKYQTLQHNKQKQPSRNVPTKNDSENLR